VAGQDVIAGMNLHLAEQNAKIQANYVRRSFGGIEPARNLLLINLQTSW
jgi:hypothetical protein